MFYGGTRTLVGYLFNQFSSLNPVLSYNMKGKSCGFLSLLDALVEITNYGFIPNAYWKPTFLDNT